MDNIIQKRRAVQHFDPNRPLSQSILKDIINLAMLAPSAFNLQPWSIIAVRSTEAKERLYPVAGKQDKVLKAPVVLIITGDRAGYRDENPEWSARKDSMSDKAIARAKRGAHKLYAATEERKIKFAESNAGLLAMSIMYAAQHYGVESHPMSGINFAGIKEAFDIPGEQEVVMLICLGYRDTAHDLHPRRPRRGYDAIVREV